MSSMFGKLFDAEMKKYEITVNQESINPQLNDWFVTELITQCTDLILLQKANKIREKVLIFSQIEANILKRFGFNVKFITDSETTMPITYPIMLKPNHIFLTAMGEDYWLDRVLDEIQDGSGVLPKNSVENMSTIRWQYTNEGELDDTDAAKDYLAVYKQYVANMKIGLSKSGIGNITIDLEKAYVNGLSTEVYGVVLLNIGYIVTKIPEITGEELAALIVHEIGHNFTSIENTKNNIDNNLTLITTLKDVCALNGKPLKRGMIRAYEGITSNIVPNPANVSDRDIALSLIEWVAKKNNLSTNKSHSINFESQADLFVSRFGLGGPLSSILNKKGDMDGSTTYAILNGAGALLTTVSIMSLIVMTGIIIQAFIILSGITKVLLSFFMSIISMIIGYNFMSNDVKPTYELYDKFRIRLQKIKNDSIRIIRTTKLDAKTKAFVIEDIEKITKYIEKSPRPSEAAFSWLWRRISRGAQLMFDMKRTEELWEQLQENELYVSKNKIDAVIEAKTGVQNDSK